jgi:4-amino-4-deoxy-L-arabinose transferase-like glycosyltransferase
MKREPVWPTLTAGLLLLTGLHQIEPEQLATRHQTLFKGMNAVFLALVVGLTSGLVWLLTRKPALAWVISLILALAALTTTPRIVNYFNNDPLAMLLLLAASALTFFASKGTWRSAISLGLALGFLALTKAQFLYIAFIPIFALGFISKKQAGLALLVFAIVVTPWLARNTITFGKPAISERGKIVAAVRMIMVAEHRPSERACMIFAFTHPQWRKQIGEVLGIGRQDFNQGARCQRFNRELCFDMGIERVECTYFPGDVPLWTRGDWRKSIQYAYRGMTAGLEIEANMLKFSDIAPLTLDNIGRYIRTLPLFAWRGMGFTAFPWLSILLTISVFFLIFTRLWPIALLSLSSNLFHILFTHNVPRYHVFELGVMIFAMAYLLDMALTLAMNRVSGKDGK